MTRVSLSCAAVTVQIFDEEHGEFGSRLVEAVGQGAVIGAWHSGEQGSLKTAPDDHVQLRASRIHAFIRSLSDT